jgi:predicted TPR repeat methyltransferase
MEDLETWLDRVYTSGGDRDRLDQLYDQWAKNYDEQLWASGNPYIAIQAGMVGRYVPDYDARILDAGCGTGNMAQVLYQIGYTNLEGLDPSAGMLEVAKRKEVYNKLHSLFLGESIDLEPESYDVVVASGVLTHGHAPPGSLDGILKISKSGGIIIFSLSKIAHDDYGFGDKIKWLDDSGAWEFLNRSRLFRTYPFSTKEEHIRHWVCAYQKL